MNRQNFHSILLFHFGQVFFALLVILPAFAVAREPSQASSTETHPLQSIIENTSTGNPALKMRLEKYRDLAVTMHGRHLQLEQAKGSRLDGFSKNPIKGLADPPQTSSLITVNYVAQSVIILNREFTGLVVAEALFVSSRPEARESSADTLAFAFVGAESQIDLTVEMLDFSIKSLNETLKNAPANTIDIYFNGDELVKFFTELRKEVAGAKKLITLRLDELTKAGADVDKVRRQLKGDVKAVREVVEDSE